MTLRRTIYLTIQSSLDFEECAHKLVKMQLKPGQEVRICACYIYFAFMPLPLNDVIIIIKNAKFSVP